MKHSQHNRHYIVRLLGAIVVMVAILALMVGCTVKVDDGLSYLNDKAHQDYSHIAISIDTTLAEDTLVSTFDATRQDNGNYSVQYSVQRLAIIDITNPALGEDRIITTGGSVLSDGNRILGDDEALDGDIRPVLNNGLVGFNFATKYFNNIVEEEGTFEADVVRVTNFLGVDSFSGHDMHVTVTYDDNALTGVVLTYTARGGSAVTINYTFAL